MSLEGSDEQKWAIDPDQNYLRSESEDYFFEYLPEEELRRVDIYDNTLAVTCTLPVPIAFITEQDIDKLITYDVMTQFYDQKLTLIEGSSSLMNEAFVAGNPYKGMSLTEAQERAAKEYEEEGNWEKDLWDTDQWEWD